ncbi:hypothetical protein OH540_21185 [Streptomyces sp. BPPL-273]|uniref:hypothetical protein n=1 Tax=Streptomyces sp. BPPL-273 TaxID=2987533 RepID=UPI0024AE99EB|nr:hypothetical protein [Streptomyces sp. BPPL-273]WHM32420.1 hypothetical protein OH540_21185 [Streptomyces sp. BPPL-273]
MSTAIALVLAAAVFWSLGYRDGSRAAARREALRAERAARLHGPHAAAIANEIAVGLQALAEACCDSWFVSAGAEHDPPCTSRWATAVACCPECAVTPGTPCHQNGVALGYAHARRIKEAEVQP